ncbi:MAG: hypothetical protein CMQ19_10810 [Gammaproteobacteria bacterium]|jgi:hypothetical protein|nr:hypothetical protein [Gammaproteobacteria bacterium]|tara:strand:+ start:970 stop:1353 length:384 start_codon:yes stop_codon:yes gene_type:complete
MKLGLLFVAAMVSSSQLLADSISFSRDIAPLFRNVCANCHLTGEEAGEIALHPQVAWSNLVNIPSKQSTMMRVKPGDSDNSYLMLKLDGTHLDAGGSGMRMPFNGTPLSEEVRAQIRAWVEEGAREN